jgi:arylformamidase
LRGYLHYDDPVFGGIREAIHNMHPINQEGYHPMELFDITVPISPDMPVWPGDSGVTITQIRSINSGDNANISHLALGAHTGTHVDAPVHFIKEGVTLDQIPLEHFVGEVQVLETLNVDLITDQVLENLDTPIDSKKVLFKTRNSAYWVKGETSFKENFVALSPNGARYLLDKEIELVGIDYLSIAPYQQSVPTHQLLLKAGVIILEGVDLSAVKPGRYILFCLPLKLVGVDGAPARVVLISS